MQTLPHSGLTGGLFVTTRRVIWLGPVAMPHVGCAWEGRDVMTVATSRDLAAPPKPCVYMSCQISDVSEVHFVLADDKTLQEVYEMCEAISQAVWTDDEDDDNRIRDEDATREQLRHLDSVLHVSPEISSMSDEIGKKADLGPEFQRVLPEAQAVAASGDVERACELLLVLEKQARLANDVATLKETVGALLTLCAQHKRWELLRAHVALLAKRRAQKSGAVTVVVQRAMEFLAETPSDAVKMELIESLRAVAEGKIFLEKERATLTQMLSRMKEARGEIDEAATILQEVHVETYGAMTKLEKTEYILEQVRLTLAKKDFVRANILAKKILRRTLEEKNFQECKLKFYHLMIEYDTHENEMLELCRHWMAIFNTDLVKEKDEMWKKALEHATVFVVLSPYSNLQNDLLHKLASEKLAEKVPDFAAVLKKFTTKEIIAFPMEQDAVLKNHPIFKHAERGAGWWKTLHTRVVEHNIRVVAEHYERIRLPHLAKMIGLAEDLTESSISTLVSDGSIYAKIDRPAKLVSFHRPLSPEEQLSDWSADISQLLRLVETTCHLVNKENMIHKV